MKTRFGIVIIILLLSALAYGEKTVQEETVTRDNLAVWVKIFQVTLGRQLTPEEQAKLERGLVADFANADDVAKERMTKGAARVLAEYESSSPELQAAARNFFQGFFREVSRRAPDSLLGVLSDLLLPADPPGVDGNPLFGIPVIGAASYASLKKYLFFCAGLLDPNFKEPEGDAAKALERNLKNTFALSSIPVREQYARFDAEYGLINFQYQCRGEEGRQKMQTGLLSLYGAIRLVAQLDMLPDAPEAINKQPDLSLWQQARDDVADMPDSFSALAWITCPATDLGK